MPNLYVLTTSGFILPDNQYYTTANPELLGNSSIFNKNGVVSHDTNLYQFSKDNDIRRSAFANKLYLEYEANPTFEQYMKLVDLFVDVVGSQSVSFVDFITIQCYNPKMTSVSFLFCKDMMSGNIFLNYKFYYTVPLSARFNSGDSLTAIVMSERARELNRLTNTNKSWTRTIASLMQDKQVFLSVYRYILTDEYGHG